MTELVESKFALILPLEYHITFFIPHPQPGTSRSEMENWATIIIIRT